MSDAVEQKLISMLDAVQNGVVEIGGTAVKYAPDVVNAVEGVVMLDGVQSLIYGVVGLILVSIIIPVAYKLEKEASSWNTGLSAIAGGLLSIFPLILVASCLLNVWTYAAIFQPKLYIAHKIIEKVM